MSAALTGSVGLDRATLETATRSVLHHGGWGNPDVLLVECDGGLVVVKDFGPRGPWVRRWLGPWLLRREARAYRRLGDLPAVPHLLGRLDEAALVFEYRPGTYLSRSLAGSLPITFLADLQAAVSEMHRRGIVHLDLRHRSNILAGEDGRPILLDFASAFCFDASKRSGRLLIGVLGWFDRRALEKWRARLA
jgi:serine/threonine protein kinase